LKPREVLLVLGGAGGVGLAAIELGRAMGAKVIAAASTPEKRAACLRAGATLAIDYERLREQCDEATDGRGIDVVFDPVGGTVTETALRATAWRGRLVVVGFASGVAPKVPMNLALLKERTIVGVYLGGSLEHDPASNSENYELLRTWHADGTIRPLISDEVSLEGVPPALSRLERRQVVGPLAVNVSAPDEGNMFLLGRVGTIEQKERNLKPLLEGRARSAFLMTEPAEDGGAGCDPSMLKTVARKEGGHWVITGASQEA
jgi:NADPH2:quinone reductase